MNGPSLGTFSRPMTVGRQVPEMSAARGPADCIKHCHRCAPRSVAAVADWLSSCRRPGCREGRRCRVHARPTAPASCSSPSGAKPQLTPMQSRPLAMAPATSWARSPTITACCGARGRPGRRRRCRSLPSGPCGCGGLVGGGAADGAEVAGDAVVLQHDLGQSFGLLGGHGDRAARQRRKPPAAPGCRGTGGSGRCRCPGSAPGRSRMTSSSMRRRNAGDVQQGITELRTDHRVQLVRAREREAEFGEGRGDSVRYSAGRIDKSAVQVEDHGHCCMSHRLSFSRVHGMPETRIPRRNTSGQAAGRRRPARADAHRTPAAARPGSRPGTRPCGSPWTWPPAPACPRPRSGRRRNRRRVPGPRSSPRS